MEKFIPGGSFEQNAPILMRRLMTDLEIRDICAAAIVGNLAHESAGLQAGIHELGRVSGKGGIGWAQWTGPRRRRFESWCQEKGLSIKDEEANYGFLLHELKGAYREAVLSLRQKQKLSNAVACFESSYEKAGVPHFDARNKWAIRALHSIE